MRLPPAITEPEDVAVRVVIATRVALYREGLAEALSARSRIAVVGTAASAGELSSAVLAAMPDAVILDTDLEDGVATAGRLTGRWPDLKIVALGGFDAEVDVIACAEAGVCAFVTPMDGLDRMIAILGSVVQDEVVCTPAIAAALLRRVKAAASETRVVTPLQITTRELDVLALVDEGLSNKEIAGRLCIKLPTVKNHMHNIMEKLDVNRRTEAVFRVRQLGLLDPPGAVMRRGAPEG